MARKKVSNKVEKDNDDVATEVIIADDSKTNITDLPANIEPKRRPPRKPLKINGVAVELVAALESQEIVGEFSEFKPLTDEEKAEIRKNLIRNSDRATQPVQIAIDSELSNNDIDKKVVETQISKNSKKKKKNKSKKDADANIGSSLDSSDINQEKELQEPTLLESPTEDLIAIEKSESKVDALSLDNAAAEDKPSKNKRKKKKKPTKQNNTVDIETSDVELVADEPVIETVEEKTVIKRPIPQSQKKQKPTKAEQTPKSLEKAPKPKAAPKKRVEILYTIIPESKQLTKSQLTNTYLTNFLDQVEIYLRKEAYIEPGGKLLLAVSGGVDSVVLLDALALLANKLRFTLYIAHFNHKLRGFSSDVDEVLVRNTSKEYNLHFYSSSGNVKQYSSKNSLSIEHAARILRYNFFERTARNINVDIVATAHTEDDLVETFFINLLRGSGLTGLSSMPSKRKFVKNVSLVRPFLQFSKQNLYEYAKIRKLKWNEDETNSLLNYTRNKIRHDLIPKLINEYNPSVIDVISRTTELIQGADEVIKDIVAKSITNVIDEANNERFSLRINMLLTFNKFMQGELIQHAWSKYFRLQPLPLATIDRILELNNSQTGSICEISSAYFVLRDRNNLIFAKRTKDIATSLIIEKPGEYKLGKYKLIISEVKPEEVVFSDDKNIEYIPAELMEPFVEIRNKKEGDYFHPLGSPGEMKLSDFLTNEKVALVDKPNVLILTNKLQILWVLGYRISEKCRVNKSIKRVYKLKIVNSEKK